MLGSGQNFFTITGESFNTISFSTNVDVVADVRQVRLGATLFSSLRSMRCSGRSASAQTRRAFAFTVVSPLNDNKDPA